jgi:hypothetical protein
MVKYLNSTNSAWCTTTMDHHYEHHAPQLHTSTWDHPSCTIRHHLQISKAIHDHHTSAPKKEHYLPQPCTPIIYSNDMHHGMTPTPCTNIIDQQQASRPTSAIHALSLAIPTKHRYQAPASSTTTMGHHRQAPPLRTPNISM